MKTSTKVLLSRHSRRKRKEPAKEVQNEPVKEEVKTEKKESVDREMEALKAYVNRLSQRDAKDESLDCRHRNR